MLVIALVATALVASWAASVIPVESSTVEVDPQGQLVLSPVKGLLFYATHGLAIISVIGAGLLAAVMGGFKTLSLGVRIALAVLSIEAVVWAASAYTPEEILSTQIFAATGPFVWLTLIFVVAGTDRRLWQYVDPVLRLLAYVSTGLALRALLESEYRSFAGFSKYTLYAQILMWFGGWTLVTSVRLGGFRLLIRAIPLMVGGVMAILCQSRSWTLQCLLIGAAFVILKNREQGNILAGVRTLLVTAVLCVAVAGLLRLALPETFSDSVNGLEARLDQDSRTGQYSAFFSAVPVQDLILGRGPKGTWFWPKVGEYQFFDNGYLWMLFIGGVPTLLCYLTIIVWPAVRLVPFLPRGPAAAAVCLVLMWALALTGLSTYSLPSVQISNFLVSLWAGRCHLLWFEHKQHALASTPQISTVLRGRAMVYATASASMSRGYRTSI